jgi:hypothetical protein
MNECIHYINGNFALSVEYLQSIKHKVTLSNFPYLPAAVGIMNVHYSFKKLCALFPEKIQNVIIDVDAEKVNLICALNLGYKDIKHNLHSNQAYILINKFTSKR